MESWTEIKISVDAKDIDRASDIANVVVPYGIYIEDYTNLEQEVEDIAHIDLIDEDLLAKDRNKAFVHIYLEPDVSPSEAVAFLSERYNAEGIKHSIELLDCLEEDWRNNWKKYFKPFPVGEKIMIKPSWEELTEETDKVILKIDPGHIFGTGTHETTQLCMELIEKYVKKDDMVLDIGCGSGILSIASLLLEAKEADAVDIDPNAIAIAYENSDRNDIPREKYHVCAGNILEDAALHEKYSGKKYDMVEANIVADIIIALTKQVPDYIKDGGIFLSSGIITERKEDVL